MSTIIPTNFVPLDEQVLMVVFHDTAVDKYGVKLLKNRYQISHFMPYGNVPKGFIDWDEEIGQYEYNCSADAVDMSVEIAEQLLRTTEQWCVVQHITVNQLLLAFIRFCGNQSNWGVASDWLEACMRKFGEVLA